MATSTRLIAALTLIMMFIGACQYLHYSDLRSATKQLNADNERLTANIASLELEIGDLVAYEAERLRQNFDAAAAFDRLKIELGLLNARFAAEHDQLMQTARLAASLETAGNQPDITTLFAGLIDERMINRDLLRTQSRRKMELQFSGVLATLGITEERLENILEALTTADLESGDLMASRAALQVSAENFNKVYSTLAPDQRIKELLNEAEFAEFEEQTSQQENTPMVDVRHRWLRLLAPGLTDETRQRSALAISRGMQFPREIFDHLNEVDRSHAIATHQIESVIPAIREELRRNLSESDYLEVDNYLRILTAEQERALRIAEAHR